MDKEQNWIRRWRDEQRNRLKAEAALDHSLEIIKYLQEQLLRYKEMNRRNNATRVAAIKLGITQEEFHELLRTWKDSR